MFSELYREEEREEGDRGSQEDKGGIKRRETDPASNQFPKCSHSPEHTKRFTELGREEKREEGDRGGLDEMRWNQKRREQASNHLLMCAPQSGPLRDVHGVTQRREEEGRRQR